MSDLVKTNGTSAVTRQATRDEQRYVTPAVDIFENESGLTLLADLPGVSQDQIDINIEGGVLTIKASVPEKQEAPRSYREYQLMNYYRQFELGEKIDQERIRADYRNGVLRLELPLAEKARPRRIEVKAH